MIDGTINARIHLLAAAVSFLKTGTVFNSFISGHFWRKDAAFQLVVEWFFFFFFFSLHTHQPALPEFHMSHSLDGIYVADALFHFSLLCPNYKTVSQEVVPSCFRRLEQMLFRYWRASPLAAHSYSPYAFTLLHVPPLKPWKIRRTNDNTNTPTRTNTHTHGCVSVQNANIQWQGTQVFSW